MGKTIHKIIVADDDRANRQLLDRILKKAGYQVFLAEDGNRVFNLTQTNTIDLIILDVYMPGLDGFETLRRLKNEQATRNIPVIFITGNNDTAALKKGFEEGIVDYLAKPFHAEELRARVKTHIEIKKNRETIAQNVKQLEETINEMSALFETGTLVAGVVHDTRKYTTAMSMSLESMIIPILKEKLDPSEDWVKDLLFDISELHANAAQCTEFLESLLAINRKNDQLEPVNVEKMINQTIHLVSYSLIQESIAWEIDCRTETHPIATGNAQLIRVFMNLIVNAADALKKHEISAPKVTIRIEETTQHIKISVIDNGPGMTKGVLKGIRKGMILSTKGKDGNGFGVSGLTKIVKNLNGKIEIESEVGKGTNFIISLQKSN